jgi:hypothetical protein
MYAYERTKTPNGPQLADRLRPVVVEAVRLPVPHDRRDRQEGLEPLPDGDRPPTGPPAAVWLGERLVEVEVDDVEPHVARTRDPADGVQVRTVVVHERARAVEDRGDLLDVLVEEPERGRVREHEARRVLVDLRAEVLDVDVAARVGLHRRHLVARHRHARRIRPMRRVGNHNLAARLGLAAVGEVRAHQEQARQLALRPGGGLEGDRGQAGDLGEDSLQAPHQLEGSLRALLFLQRMEILEAGQVDDPLVHARVVLHRAGPERIEAGVNAERPRREVREVADQLGLGDLGEPRRPLAPELVGHLRDGQVVAREARRTPALLRALVDQLHAASTSASRSMSASVRFSVTHTSSASSMPA